jgi:hypothetical protein
MEGHSHTLGCHCESDDTEKFSLYRFVNVPGLRGLNVDGNCANLFRPENEKARHDLFVESDDDDELILIVPFTGSVRLRKIVIGASGESCPVEVRIFKNVDVAFDTVNDTPPTQTIMLGDDENAELEHAVVNAKFNDCRTLSLFFPASRGGDKIRLFYIGMFGDYLKPQAKLANVVYESVPQPKEHKVKDELGGAHALGM